MKGRGEEGEFLEIDKFRFFFGFEFLFVVPEVTQVVKDILI